MTTEKMSRTGEGLSDDLSPTAGLKSAVAEFMSDLKGFRAEIHTKLQ